VSFGSNILYFIDAQWRTAKIGCCIGTPQTGSNNTFQLLHPEFVQEVQWNFLSFSCRSKVIRVIWLEIADSGVKTGFLGILVPSVNFCRNAPPNGTHGWQNASYRLRKSAFKSFRRSLQPSRKTGKRKLQNSNFICHPTTTGLNRRNRHQIWQGREFYQLSRVLFWQFKSLRIPRVNFRLFRRHTEWSLQCYCAYTATALRVIN
jgi:hypothetical protein